MPVGGTATFTVEASGTAPLTYQWKKNTVDIPLATAASYTTPAVTKADSGARFVCVVTNGLGSVTSNLAMLHVVTLPPVVSILANFSFETGTTPTVFYTNGAGSFDNTPAGSGSPRAGHISIATEGSNVQLYQLGVTLEANTVYTLSFKARSSSGNDVTINVQQHGAPYASYGLNKEFNLTTAWNTYAVEFTTQNFSGTVNDGRFMFWLAPYDANGDEYFFDEILLAKKQTTPVPPAIVTHPTDQTVPVGGTATFTVEASGTAPLTYQWKKNTVDIPLATAASYTTPAVTKADSGARFVCVVTNGLGSVTSNPAMLHVVTLPPVVSILANFSFETGTTPWVFYTNGAGSFDNTPAGSGSPRAGHVSIATEGSNVQLYQPGVTLEANTVYTLSFKARSSSGNDVTINVQQHVLYASYGLSKEFNLTTAWNTYAVEFTTQNFSGTVNDGRFMFWLAPYDANGDEYFFDEILLAK